MKLLYKQYLKEYISKLPNLKEKLNNFKITSIDLDFDYLTKSSSVFSSNIEWNTMNLNSFMNFSLNKNKTKDIEEIENLINAYKFAQESKLNEKNFLKSHFILSKTLLIKSRRWVYRDDKVGVFGENWLIYLAIESSEVEKKMKDLFDDIEFLLRQNLSLEEIFYFASMIHLVFVHIHPFADWNGRSARLLEKWFLVEKLWSDLWKIQLEKYYKENIINYYENINLWVNYYELDYSKSINFLLMLTKAI